MEDREDPSWLQQVDHTADAGFDVQGKDERELFERAAWAMFDFLCEIRTVEELDVEEVEVEASDREALMVKWLSELNFLHITEERLFRSFEINNLTGTRLSASVRGERIDFDRHEIYTEIKAVTFHGLKIEEAEDGFQARIIFDL